MINLFFYVGTVFLRKGAETKATSWCSKEVNFALDNLLPQELTWEVVFNYAETAGKKNIESHGQRRFKYFDGEDRTEILMSYFIESSLDEPSLFPPPSSLQVHSFETSSIRFMGPEKYEFGERRVGDTSGRVRKTEIDRLAEELILRVRGRGPVFSVSDCNSFHNSAYLLGYMALKNAPRPALIINFDQHLDIGTPDSETPVLIASDRWGHYLVDTLGEAAYVVMGAGGDTEMANQVTAIAKSEGGLVKAPRTVASELKRIPTEVLIEAGEALRRDMKSNFDALKAMSGGKEFASVFITIDRDCMARNWTQWGNSKKYVFGNHKEVIKSLGVVLDALVLSCPRVQFCGMDVTGLPEEGCGPAGASSDPEARKIDPSRLLGGPTQGCYSYESVRKELTDYHDFFASRA